MRGTMRNQWIFRSIALWCFCAGIVFSACTPINTQKTVVVPTLQSSSTYTDVPFALPSSTLIIAPSPIPNTATATATITPHPMSVIEKRCLQVQDGALPKIDGIVAISKLQSEEASYFLNLQNGEISVFSETFDEKVSPDYTKLLYYDVQSISTQVIDANQKLIANIPDSSEQYLHVEWLNNTNILLDKRGENFPRELPTLVIYNIETKIHQDYNPVLPNFFDFPNEVRWDIYSRIVPHPSLDYLLYPARKATSNPTEVEISVVLWDMIHQREIQKIIAGTYFQPVWSPDGNSFILGAPPRSPRNSSVVFTNTKDTAPFYYGSELLRVDLRGNVERLTYLSKDDISNVNNFTWSPDGQRIAFGHLTGSVHPDTPGVLSILDVESEKIVDYCISGIPKWSADSKYILLTHTKEQFMNEVYIIDIETAQAWLLAENATAIGWMVAP